MTVAPTSREAKEFLVSEIVAEAERENVPLSELERKMLYFSETAWSLPDIYEINEAFEKSYDSGEYEAKTSHLIRNLVQHLRKHDTRALETWKQAVRTIKQEDHYLLVLIGIADGTLAPAKSEHRPWRFTVLQLLLIIFGGAAILLAAIAIYLRLTGQI